MVIQSGSVVCDLGEGIIHVLFALLFLLVQTFGSNIWFKHLVQTFGSNIFS